MKGKGSLAKCPFIWETQGRLLSQVRWKKKNSWKRWFFFFFFGWPITKKWQLKNAEGPSQLGFKRMWRYKGIELEIVQSTKKDKKRKWWHIFKKWGRKKNRETGLPRNRWGGSGKSGRIILETLLSSYGGRGGERRKVKERIAWGLLEYGKKNQTWS